MVDSPNLDAVGALKVQQRESLDRGTSTESHEPVPAGIFDAPIDHLCAIIGNYLSPMPLLRGSGLKVFY